METIHLLIIIIAILGFLIMVLVNCVEYEEESKKAVRIKGNNSSAFKLNLKKLGNKEPNSANFKVKNETSIKTAPKMASSKVVQVPVDKPKSRIGKTKAVVSAFDSDPSVSLKMKSSTVFKVKTHLKLPFQFDLGPVLVDHQTYEMLNKKYIISPSHKSVVHGKSSMCTSSLPGSESSRLSNYKTQSFAAEANSKTGVQQEDDKKEVKKDDKNEENKKKEMM